MKKVKYLILGAGPTGLGAANRLKELNENDFLVIDKEKKAGGLSSSFIDEKGFTWDLGGHVQFSHYKYFDDLMKSLLGDDGWLFHQRESWVWMCNRFIPYPFQNNIKFLPKEIMWECLEGIINLYANPGNKIPLNFEEWIYSTLGTGLAKHFMLPYNYKVWAYEPKFLSAKWVGERVAITDLKRVTQNILFDKEDISWGPNSTFQFPKYGGTGSIWTSLFYKIGEDKFLFDNEVIEINSELKIVKTTTTEIQYEYLLTTIPINELCKRIVTNSETETLINLTKKLKFSSTHVIGIGLNGKPKDELKTKCWMYFPEDNCPFYRVTVFSNYSPNNVPSIQNQWSLMAEVSESTDKFVNQESVIDETILGLINTKLIDNKNNIESIWYKRLEYGYPTPSLERDEIMDDVNGQLEKINIYSRGRFGFWKYEVSNQDHSLMQGVEWVNYMLLGLPEITFKYPNFANSNFAK